MPRLACRRAICWRQLHVVTHTWSHRSAAEPSFQQLDRLDHDHRRARRRHACRRSLAYGGMDRSLPGGPARPVSAKTRVPSRPRSIAPSAGRISGPNSATISIAVRQVPGLPPERAQVPSPRAPPDRRQSPPRPARPACSTRGSCPLPMGPVRPMTSGLLIIAHSSQWQISHLSFPLVLSAAFDQKQEIFDGTADRNCTADLEHPRHALPLLDALISITRHSYDVVSEQNSLAFGRPRQYRWIVCARKTDILNANHVQRWAAPQ